MRRGIFKCFAVVLALFGVASAPLAQDKGGGPMSLFMTYRCPIDKRVAFREYAADAGVAQFETWKQQGVFSDYLMLFSSFANGGETAPDMVVRLDFERYADIQRWKAVERSFPAGLSARALQLCAPATTDLVDLSFAGGPAKTRNLGKAVYLWIPYHLERGVSKGQYKEYFKGYVKPQADGWLTDGALSWWGMYLNQHYTGKPWDTLFLLEYADLDGLSRREVIKQQVRARLNEDPVWKKLSDNKQEIRQEDQVVIMDPILPTAKHTAVAQ
jgi:hypothetical protein